MTDILFEPVKIGRLEIKNRITMPAMHMNMARNFEVTDALLDFYAERARGGAGLITVGYATVDLLSGGKTNIGAHDDAFIPGLARLARTIKENGARAAVQINHAGRYSHSFLIGQQAVAPSAVASRFTRETPRELGREEIPGIVQQFAEAALRVEKAGYDAVEVLSGTGYLISQFLSPLTNQRTDEYGGPYENRMRFGLEIMRAIKALAGADFPLVVRMNGNDFMEGGQGRRPLLEYAEALAQAGVDALCINVGWHEARVPQIVTSVPRGLFGYMSRGIKERVIVPVIASHRINDPATAREMIQDGLCDMVAMGRPLIADPELPEKARTGRENEIVHCIGCAQGCFDHLQVGRMVECLCNPRAGHEKETRIEKTAAPKKVLVVGGGPAGMSAAAAAADRGHQVTLSEKSPRLGGQLHLASIPPGREEFEQLARDMETQLSLRRVRVLVNQEVDEAFLKKEKPDQVLLATGATPIRPTIPGVELPHVVQAWDVLIGKKHTGRRVAVVGGGAVGVETALFLAEKGTLSGEGVKFLLVNRAESAEDLYQLATRGTKEVELFEMMDRIGSDIGRSTRWVMLQDLQRHGIKTHVGAKVVEITEAGLKVENGEGGPRIVKVDTVVLAVGSRPYNPLAETVEKLGIPCRVVGDADKVGLAYDAIHQGFAAGREI
jgi:2,4-dienoyl-CoA reductase (NADPH2)